MDADTLRLILIVLGGLFLVALYLWERSRSRPRGASRRAVPRREPAPEPRREEPRREPRLGPWEGRDDPDGLPDFDGDEPHELARTGPPGVEAGPIILQLHVSAAGGRFDGAEIVRAADRYGLEPGEMDIFHRPGDEDEGPRFSMANMVKPGTFPFGAMADFESPGLVLFAEAHGDPGDPDRLDEMLDTAHGLAEDLDGTVLDDRRKPLTAAAEARLRERVLALSEGRAPMDAA
jgi:cell division protein ZipA